MKKFAEYRQHAAECRALAKKMPAEDQRRHLLDMAENWDRLALERERSMKLTAEPSPSPVGTEPTRFYSDRADGTFGGGADSYTRRTPHD